jgi:hypothetical protein
MAIVQRVLDTASGRELALKRLHTRTPQSDANHAQIVALFEREYLTLSELAHPRIVEVYDYGIDETGPYYTMELLDGGDLHGLAPLSWQRACALARDVCSALALLHSRRAVYRDLSPRNVRCTSDGHAKLIDFGAMAPMGVTRDLVGTLPIVAPEALNHQPLDARTDLYALGASLYFTLLQRHAYPARDPQQLRDFWRSRPRRPREIIPSIPPALDQLVIELMQLDPAARPASASEVMERLSAIGGVRSSEQHVSQAYLSNPTLVGRTAQLGVARKLILRALRGRGGSILIEGPPGVGRTRFLAACVLEAKLAGSLVLRADAVDSSGAQFDTMRALARQLLGATRPLAIEAAESHLSVLGRVIPELVLDRPDVALDATSDSEQFQRLAQHALRHWLLEIARHRPLMLALDDFSTFDAASIACIALLAQEVSEHNVMIAATAHAEHGPDYAAGALTLFTGASTMLQLEPLTLELTVELLNSVFGDVPNLDAVAQYVQRITCGNLRDIMRVAQHLVNEGAVAYCAGTWRLPARLSATELPTSMADALRARIDKLSLPARTIARGLSCDPGQRFSFEECAILLPGTSNASLLRALDELVEAEVLQTGGHRYWLGEQGWSTALQNGAGDELTLLHLRLADVFARRGESFRAARHLLAGDECERGVDVLLADALASEQRTDGDPRAFFDLLSSLPADWLSTYEHALRCCAEQHRPARDADTLLSRLSGLVSHAVSQTDGYEHIQRRLDALARDCGLDLFAAQPATTDFATRLKRSLEGAAARFQQTSEHERVWEPGPAMKQIAKTVLTALGTIAFSQDYEAWKKVPSLAPLTPLSPALAVVELLSQGVGARISARNELAIRSYETLLGRLDRPDRSGLDASHHHTAVLRVKQSIGILEAGMGLKSSLARAEQVETEPAYATQALTIRHLYHVWQGETFEAARIKRMVEIQQVEASGHHGFEGQHLLSELCAYALSDDMTRVKRATDAIEPRALLHRAWQPAFLYGLGEYHRIRGDYLAALELLESALALAKPGEHQLWPNAAGALLRTLAEAERYDEVRSRGEAYLSQAGQCGLGYVRIYLRMPLSLALSKLGERAAAVALAQSIVDELLALASTGINLAAAYETRARVALDAGDQTGAEHYAALAREQWRSGRKKQQVTRRGLDGDPRIDDGLLDEVSVLSQMTSILESCPNAAERARCGLDYLGRHSGAAGGLLYLHTDGGLMRAACLGQAEASVELDRWAHTYFERELYEDEATGMHDAEATSQARDHMTVGGRRYVPVLLTHQAVQGVAITGVALLVDSDAFTYPGRVAAELSRATSEAGDAIVSYV